MYTDLKADGWLVGVCIVCLCVVMQSKLKLCGERQFGERCSVTGGHLQYTVVKVDML